ncbi:MAG: phosphopantothenoylcysteine decarboxylase, partial [Nitrospiraceae bacterium]
LKKTGTAWKRLELEQTDDILELLSRQRTSQILVGFAAETQALESNAKEKLRRKGLDLVVGNNVAAEGSGFGSDTNAAIIVDREGRVTRLDLMPKRALADRILDAVQALGTPAKRAASPYPFGKR